MVGIKCQLDLSTFLDGYENRDRIVPIIKMGTLDFAIDLRTVPPASMRFEWRALSSRTAPLQSLMLERIRL